VPEDGGEERIAGKVFGDIHELEHGTVVA
jgi:hypothetical protein